MTMVRDLFLHYRLSLLNGVFACVLLIACVGCGGDSDDEEKLQEIPVDASAIQKSRAEKDKFFKYDAASPIPSDLRKSFSGLRYFPYDEAYVVIASFEASSKADTIHMPASKGEIRPMINVGVFSFSIGSEEKVYQLSGFRAADGSSKSVLIPFKDRNSGNVCYGAGRYVEVEESGDECTIDFNLAYNPFCAYNESYSCLLIPPQNVLSAAINAGEKNYHSSSATKKGEKAD